MANELSPRQKEAEDFCKKRIGSFSIQDEEKICESYKKHILGVKTYAEMGPIHAGIKKGKEDYASFYHDIADILKPTENELEILVSEGFDWAGLMCLLASQHDYSTRTPAGGIICNMVCNK
jgi:hypothetical protein